MPVQPNGFSLVHVDEPNTKQPVVENVLYRTSPIRYASPIYDRSDLAEIVAGIRSSPYLETREDFKNAKNFKKLRKCASINNTPNQYATWKGACTVCDRDFCYAGAVATGCRRRQLEQVIDVVDGAYVSVTIATDNALIGPVSIQAGKKRLVTRVESAMWTQEHG